MSELRVSEAEPQARTETGFAFRNAMNDWDHVPADLAADGGERTPPFVTIGIPTYKRADLLAEAVQSALAQGFARPVEILVVDNDPDSRGAEDLLERLPELRRHAFRYYVNRENVGVFPNWNRCIELARGEWVTILNDDDLLDPNYLDLMFAEIDRLPKIDGIVCLKRFFGGTHEASSTENESAPAAGEPMSGQVLHRLVASSAGRRALLKRVVERALVETRYLGRTSRRIAPRKFFWGAVLGNGGGFIFKRAKALEIGGYYPEEFPTADLYFYTRLAKMGHLRQHRAIAASIRKTEGNITVNTVTEQLAEGYKFYQTLAASEVPRWWRRTIPFMIARDRAEYARVWNTDIPQAEVEQALGMRLPRDRPRLHAALRVLMGGQ